jgi:protein CMS1
MAHHRGDDLEDDFMPDETVAFSEDEGSVSLVGDQDDIGKLLSADEEEEGAESPMGRTKAPSDEKKRRRREKEKERKAKACLFQLTAGLDRSLMFLTRDALFQQKRKLNETSESGNHPSATLQSSTMISEYLSTMQAKSFSKMSALELQDRHIPGTCVLGGLSEDLHG